MNKIQKRISEIEKDLQTEDGKDLGGISLEAELKGIKFTMKEILKMIDKGDWIRWECKETYARDKVKVDLTWKQNESIKELIKEIKGT